MERSIQDLADHLYQEGVRKGEAQAREVVAQAQERARQILAEARAEEQRIRAEAARVSEETKKQTEAQLRLAGRQAMEALRQRITTVVTARAVEPGVAQVLSDPGLVAELLKIAVAAWDPSRQGTPALEVLLPASRQTELQDALKNEVARLLAAGVAIRFGNEIAAGFEIALRDGSYRVSMTDEAFAALFREFLGPRVRALLFREQS